MTPWPGTPWGDAMPGNYPQNPQSYLADHHTLNGCNSSPSAGPSTTHASEHFRGQDSVKGKIFFNQQGVSNVMHDPTQIIQNIVGNNAIKPHI